MADVFLSVIIPVYNARKTLSKCLNSVLSQDFTDFEVLLIDDGSTDDSYLVCDEFSLTDERIRVFHNENHGPSYSRNFGIENATGEFVCFIDSDDYIKDGYFSFMHKNAVDCGCDVLLSGFSLKEENGDEKDVYIPRAAVTKENIKENAVALKSTCLLDSPCNKFYSREFLNKNGLRFGEGRNYEDSFMNIKMLAYSPIIEVYPDCFYVYVQRMGSLTKKYDSEKIERAKETARLFKETVGSLNGYSDFFFIKSVISSLSDMFFKNSGVGRKKKKRLIKKEILSEEFIAASEKAKGISKADKLTVFAAKYLGPTGIYLYCKAVFLLKFKFRKLFLKVK